MVNPHWNQKIDVHRVAFPRPARKSSNSSVPTAQGLPMLVMDKDRAPGDAMPVGDYAILQDVRHRPRPRIRHGGAGPHP